MNCIKYETLKTNYIRKYYIQKYKIRRKNFLVKLYNDRVYIHLFHFQKLKSELLYYSEIF
jgi:hypothetical protein